MPAEMERDKRVVERERAQERESSSIKISKIGRGEQGERVECERMQWNEMDGRTGGY